MTSNTSDPASKALSRIERRFRDEYLIDLNGTRAVLRCGFRGKRPDVKASKMLARPHVRAAIDKAIAERAERTRISADQVVSEWEAIARADAGEISEYRRECCRYCWGAGHRYQHTPAEMERRRAEHDRLVQEAGKVPDAKPVPTFNELGGVGFNPHRAPHPECPECFGEGVGREYFHDTRHLSADGRALFAGVKVTKEGVEIKTHSKDRALEALGRHLGMDKKLLELTGKNGGPIEHRDVDSLTDVELEAIARTGLPASAEPQEGAG
jgi:phage terminase small subunit